MKCQENLPKYTGGTDLLEWIDPTGFAPSRADDYQKIAEQLVNVYRLTLCDEADAALVGQLAHYYAQLPRMMTRWPNDFNKLDYINFLRSYLRHNGQSFRRLPAQFHGLFPASGVSAEMQQAAIYALSKAEILAEIHKLTNEYSRQTAIDTPAQAAEPGETIVRGTGIDFASCRPGEAAAFKGKCNRRAAGHWSEVASSSPSRSARYQRMKCGDREYSLRTDASAQARAPLADGLTPNAPGSAKRGYGFDCCILEAKYSSGGALALYQPYARYRRNLRKRAALIRGPGSGIARQAFIRTQQARYVATRGSVTAQLTAYMGAVSDPDIPYWRIVYICSNERTRDYFRARIRELVVARLVARACMSSMRRKTQHWKN